jgi:capsid protein
LRRAWLNCEWTGINKPSIDPQKEATAADVRIAAGLTTREREAKLYNGSEYDDNAAQLAIENAALAAANESLQPAPEPAPAEREEGRE